ncbi:MAG: class I SAM-dependent methyltransferase [Candidatus Omnitrophica bacterium]|nr:class I SAM-dependent methyltransferase [Candidatus Omnitrophota bacterium]
MKYFKSYLHARILRLMKAFDFQNPVLEAGCGTGETLELLSRQYDIKGVDISQEALVQCRVKGLNVEERDLATIEETFCSVLCIDVIEHVKDDRAFIGHLYRIMRPGGNLFVLVPSGKMMKDDIFFGHYRRYSKEAIVSLLEEAGFTIRHTEMFGFPVLYYLRHVMNSISRLKIEAVDPQERTLKSSFENAFDGSVFARALMIPAVERALSGMLQIQNLFAGGKKGFAVIAIAHKKA